MLKIIKDLLDIIIKIILIKTLIKRRPRYRRGRHNKNQTKLWWPKKSHTNIIITSLRKNNRDPRQVTVVIIINK